MKKLLIIAPHLSTGGCPQVIVNKIELLKDTYQIKCVEYSNLADIFRVQKDRIINLIGLENFIILTENKEEVLMNLIDEFQPDFISLEEIPEFFLDEKITKRIYSNDRKYTITETTHDSSFPVERKRWFPDKFIFVSAFSAFKYSVYDIPYEIVEYPVDFKLPRKSEMQTKLNFDPSYKHVVNVGLFTQRKNQAYIFELAKRLLDYKIVFHFLGNLAGNFQSYWEPLIQNKPNNCMVWGERNDVYDFLEASDLFLFTSKGDKNNKELNPIAIKEALEYQLPMMMYNLDVYCGKYDEYKNITYLTGDIETDINNLKQILNMNTIQEKFSLSFDENENKIYVHYNGNEPVNYKVSIKDMTSKCPMYWFNFQATNSVTWFVIPIPSHVTKFKRLSTFRGFDVDFYNGNNELVFSKEFTVNDIELRYPIFKYDSLDCSWRNYNEFFVDDIYRNFNINNLDTVIDIGANIGLFAKYMYSKGAQKVVLVEANPNLEEKIKNMLDDDNNRSSVYLSPIFSEKKTVTFNYSSNNSAIGSIAFDSTKGVDYESLTNSMELETITLDEIIEKEGINRISLLKCDIEGGEYDLIPSLTDKQMSMIDKFMIEIHLNDNNQIQSILDKLESHGFKYKIYSPTLNSMVLSDKSTKYGMLVTY
jgi:FkbM family methyltransferase